MLTATNWPWSSRLPWAPRRCSSSPTRPGCSATRTTNRPSSARSTPPTRKAPLPPRGGGWSSRWKPRSARSSAVLAVSSSPMPGRSIQFNVRSRARGQSCGSGVDNTMPIRAVVFDVGETLIDETRVWGAWADWFGVPHLTLFGVLGGLIARGEDFRRLFEIMRPGSSFREEWEARAAAGRGYRFDAADLYPDVVPCLAALRASGYRLGVAGNQPDAAETALNAM